MSTSDIKLKIGNIRNLLCSISFETSFAILSHPLGNSSMALGSCSTSTVPWLFVWPRLSGPQRTALPDGHNRAGLHSFVEHMNCIWTAQLCTAWMTVHYRGWGVQGFRSIPFLQHGWTIIIFYLGVRWDYFKVTIFSGGRGEYQNLMSSPVSPD